MSTSGESARTEAGVAAKHGLLAPVRRIPTDPEADAPAPGIGLCLSGGGYRAMLFHAGSLWRLNEAGYLRRIDRISSVSGGSIIAGMLASRWRSLQFDAEGKAANLKNEVFSPLLDLASKTLDVRCVVEGLLMPGSTINDRLAAAYGRELFHGFTLRELPDKPEFIFNATSLQTGDLWRFGKSTAGDWRVGHMDGPDTDLGAVVAASSAFPPVLSPAVLTMDAGRMSRGASPEVSQPPYTTRAVLADGGVYDNLGLETVWKKFATVLISDGGGHMADDPGPGRIWVQQFLRVLHVIDNQVRDLRKRQAVASFVDGQRSGAYWGIRSHVRDFGLANPIANPPDETIKALAATPTRLAKISAIAQKRLINWGYLICDTALRRWVEPDAGPGSLPYPDAGLGG